MDRPETAKSEERVSLSRSRSATGEAATANRATGAWPRLRRFSPSTIRSRITLLTGAGLVALFASNFYLSQSLERNSAATIEMAQLLSLIEQAENAELAFGELRYWMT